MQASSSSSATDGEQGSGADAESQLMEILERVRAMEKDLRIAPDGAINSNAAQYGPEAGFPRLPDCSARRTLDAGAYATLFAAGSTRNGWNVDKALQAAANARLLGSAGRSGVKMGDEDSYELLASLVAPVVRDVHGVDVAAARHVPDLDAGKVTETLSAAAAVAVRSLRVSLSRNVAGMSMPPLSGRAERRHVERVLRGALKASGQEGSFKPRADMSRREAAMLAARGFITDPTAGAAGANDWPDARTAFVAASGSTCVYINGDDHVQVTAEAAHGDARAQFATAAAALASIEAGLQTAGKAFAVHPALGALTSDLDLIGSAMTVTATVALPALAARPDLAAYCARSGLAVAPASAASAGGLVTLRTTRTLGVPEPDVVNDVVRSLNTLVALDAALARGDTRRVDAELGAAA